MKATIKGNGNSANGRPGQIQAVREAPLVEQPRPALKPGEIEVTLVYPAGQKVITVPQALFSAMTEPGETSVGPLVAMKMISQFYKDTLSPELENVVLSGDVSVPASMLSAMAQNSYRIHSGIAANQTAEVKDSLFLDDKEIQQHMKAVAAVMMGKSIAEIQKLDLDEVGHFVTRTVEKTVTSAEIRMGKQTIRCDMGSHWEERNFAIPETATIKEVREKRDEMFSDYLKAKDTLDRVFGEIEEKRGRPLDSDERNVIVSRINTNYISDPEKRIPIVP